MKLESRFSPRLSPILHVVRTTPRRALIVAGAMVAALSIGLGTVSAANRDSLVFHYVEDHQTDGGRSGEGSIVDLADGRLMLLYSDFHDGAADHSPANIVRRYSSDGGKSWSKKEIAFARPESATNIMSASLLRLRDGRIGCVILYKWTASTRCIPNWTTSSDGGLTWSKSEPMTADHTYFVGNNDRLIQMRDGTLVFPYARHRNTETVFDSNAECGILISKDAGKTWSHAADEKEFQKEWYVRPEPFRPEKVLPTAVSRVKGRVDLFQEPGVVELDNGRLMMWARSNSHVFVSYLDRLDGKWEPYRPAPGINTCLGPQTIKRLPNSKRLVMLYNDRDPLGYGEPGYSNRTPLSVAVSDDEGKSWKKLPGIETDDTRNYCYSSLLFFKDRFITSYYESSYRTGLKDANGKPDLDFDGRPRRRNLSSLKTCFGPLAFFQK